LPSKALKKRQEHVRTIESELKTETDRNKTLSEQLAALKASGDNEADEEEKRAALFDEYDELSEEKTRVEKEIGQYRDNDPEVFNKMRLSAAQSKKACNRWIENIFLLKSWLKSKFRVDESVIEKQFDIPADLDYIS
jgi:hypothetical protein